MNAVGPSTVSLLTASDFPTIPSPTISGVLAGRGGFLQAAPPLPEGFALHDRLRRCSAGSPTDADRIEFTLPALAGGRCYGLAVLVPLLSTPCCHDAVTVQYLTILHRMEANFHRFNRTPSQAHDRGRDEGLNLAPPSKPDRPISGIRLSGCWSERNGLTQTWQTLNCAIQAMPRARHSRFRGPSESNPVSGGLVGSSTNSLWGTMLDRFMAFHRHRSHQLPMSLGSTIITRFFATTDTLTPAPARVSRVSVQDRSP